MVEGTITPGIAAVLAMPENRLAEEIITTLVRQGIPEAIARAHVRQEFGLEEESPWEQAA